MKYEEYTFVMHEYFPNTPPSVQEGSEGAPIPEGQPQKGRLVAMLKEVLENPDKLAEIEEINRSLLTMPEAQKHGTDKPVRRKLITPRKKKQSTDPYFRDLPPIGENQGGWTRQRELREDD